MTAFTRTHDDATWTTGNYVTVTSDWQSLANKLASGINADRGGAWAPAAAIAFTAGNFRVTGHTLVAFGGSILGAGAGPFRVSGAGEWPRFAVGHPFRKRKILQPMLFAQHDTPGMWLPLNGSLASVAITVQDASAGLSRPGILTLPLRVHDGATLARATLSFRVLSARTKAPLALPRYRIIRTDRYGIAEPLASTAIGADAGGWITPPTSSKSSGSAWYANGAPQRLVYGCDQNHVIDISQYTYWAEVDEEHGPEQAVAKSDIDGAVVRERKLDVRFASTGDSVSGGLLDSGSSLTATDRFLFKDGFSEFSGVQTIGAIGNGIFTTDGAVVNRTDDLSKTSDISPNFIIAASRGGLVNKYRFFEVRTPYPTVVGPLSIDPGAGADQDLQGGSPIYFGPLRPTGNAYASVLVEFENIQDMRFQ